MVFRMNIITMGYTEWHGREEEKPPPEEGEERKVGETFTISFQRPSSRRRSLGQEVIGKGREAGVGGWKSSLSGQLKWQRRRRQSQEIEYDLIKAV